MHTVHDASPWNLVVNLEACALSPSCGVLHSCSTFAEALLCVTRLVLHGCLPTTGGALLVRHESLSWCFVSVRCGSALGRVCVKYPWSLSVVVCAFSLSLVWTNMNPGTHRAEERAHGAFSAPHELSSRADSDSAASTCEDSVQDCALWRVRISHAAHVVPWDALVACW